MFLKHYAVYKHRLVPEQIFIFGATIKFGMTFNLPFEFITISFPFLSYVQAFFN